MMPPSENITTDKTLQRTTTTTPLTIHVEAAVHPNSCTPLSTIRNEIKRLLDTSPAGYYCNGPVNVSSCPMIQNNCASVEIVDLDTTVTTTTEEEDVADHHSSTISSTPVAEIINPEFTIHAFVLSSDDAEIEELDAENDDSAIAASEILSLPHANLHKSWDNLILPPNVKNNLLSYASSALLFSDKKINPHVISFNRLILLHGPPGTGKTSLCRALAHKLAIRQSHRFAQASLLEIHSHSLFSKWFSESGKLVAKLFTKIKEMAEDESDVLFCVLVDEVESLTSMRKGGGDGAAGGDAVRAVNALLMAIDRLRGFDNVIVLTTSNLTENIDDAFLDRVDVKQYVGLPILEARYEILRSCINELARTGIVGGHERWSQNGSTNNSPFTLAPYKILRDFCHVEIGDDGDQMTKLENMFVNLNYEDSESEETKNMKKYHLEFKLLKCAARADGLSGRSLRKLPLQSHALFIRKESVAVEEFLHALERGILREQQSRHQINNRNDSKTS